MSTTATSSAGASMPDSGAIYHELNPKIVWLVRIVNIITLLMVIIAVIITIVQASHVNTSYYLLVCNLAISSLVCLVVNWWYKRGDLGSEKYWFIILVGAVIFLQCVTTDLFVFRNVTPETTTTVTTTTTTTTTTPAQNGTTIPVSWLTNIPPFTKYPNI